MTAALVAVIVILGGALVAAGATHVRERRRVRSAPRRSTRRVLFPFVGQALSQRGLDAALRLARVEGAELVPALIVQVPMRMPLDSAQPRQCEAGMPLLEAVEQRAMAQDVAVDSRIARGRTVRHALRDLIAAERYDRIVVAAAGTDTEGFHGEDIAWLLDNAPGEVLIVRPEHEDRVRASAA